MALDHQIPRGGSLCYHRVVIKCCNIFERLSYWNVEESALNFPKWRFMILQNSKDCRNLYMYNMSCLHVWLS